MLFEIGKKTEMKLTTENLEIKTNINVTTKGVCIFKLETKYKGKGLGEKLQKNCSM